MLALVARGSSETELELVEIEEPRPRAGEALVEVRAVSLNRGEVRRLADAEAGERPGWDVAGVVRRAAADGSGPREGTRVVGLTPGGGWAQRAAVSTDVLAALPDQVSDAQAAALPIAGLTALRALHRGGLLLGARVLVTGAAGGWGASGCSSPGSPVRPRCTGWCATWNARRAWRRWARRGSWATARISTARTT